MASPFSFSRPVKVNLNITLHNINFVFSVCFQNIAPLFDTELECGKIVDQVSPLFRALKDSAAAVTARGGSSSFLWAAQLKKAGSLPAFNVFLDDARMAVWGCVGNALAKIGVACCDDAVVSTFKTTLAEITSVSHPCPCVISQRIRLYNMLQHLGTTLCALNNVINNMRTATTFEESRLRIMIMVTVLGMYHKAVSDVSFACQPPHAATALCPCSALLNLAKAAAAQPLLPMSPPTTPLSSSSPSSFSPKPKPTVSKPKPVISFPFDDRVIVSFDPSSKRARCDD